MKILNKKGSDMIMYKNKTAMPVSVSDFAERFDLNGCYLGERQLILTVQGDCISKVYKDNKIESLNPPFARGGTICSVKYEADKDISIVEYRFSGELMSRLRNSRRFKKKMEAKIVEQKVKDFKSQLLKQENENIK